jgi:hypothetical protein
MHTKTIALVGGTGHLGTLIADAILAKPDAQLRVLVRPGSRDKAVGLEKRGATIVEGTVEDGESLASLCKGASAVVSALQGGPDVIIEGQTRLLRAARETGVIRLIPSDYSLDLFKVTPGHIPTSDIASSVRVDRRRRAPPRRSRAGDIPRKSLSTNGQRRASSVSPATSSTLQASSTPTSRHRARSCASSDSARSTIWTLASIS